jgi:signal transduction histidine kinase/CheY-like chemotaxis protein
LRSPSHVADNSSIEGHNALYAGLNLIDQGFALLDEELCLVAWNTTFLRMLDFSDTLIQVGTPFESVIRYNATCNEYGDGDVELQIRQRVDAAHSFQPYAIEHVRPNGTVLRIHGVPVPGHGFLNLYTDVTEQRRAEKLAKDQNALLELRVAERTVELRRSEAQMRLITDSVPALIAYFDQDRSYRYINRGYQDWFGLDPSQPQLVSAREFLGLETYTQIRPNVAEAWKGNKVTFEYNIHTIDDRTLLARTTLIPELAADGTVIGCFELTFDISDERQAMGLLVQAQKMEALGQLTGGLAHDFNNILMVVLGNLTALSEQAAVQVHVAEFINPAIDAARRGSKLIRGLLSFSRKQPIEACTMDLNPLVSGVEELVSHTLPGTLRLSTEVANTPIIVSVDPQQLQNSLLNLIVNARDATEGQGTIHLSCASQRLDAHQAALLGLTPGPYACLRVDDNGCGMDAVTRARVFEPFFTTKSAGHGTGLGMAMVYGFTRQSGGSIDIQSAPGAGTSVSLWLPALAPVANTVANDELARSETPGLALLVDDDLSVRQTVRRLLMELGYSVLEAQSGDEAVEILEQTPQIQLLLSDIVMPGHVDGRQLARHAINAGRVEHIILMSGYASDTNHRLEVPLLSKPFTKSELATALLESGA